MQEPKAPDNESQRLESLREHEILDTLPEGAYDDLVALAAKICEVPIALVSLVDENRQWFKARFGLDAEQTPRSVSFCGHVVQDDKPLFVPDAFDDERFADNPLVTGAPNVRFYGGIPLRTQNNTVLGTLCVIDHEPRQLDDAQLAALEALSRTVIRLLDNRLDGIHARKESEISDTFFTVSLDLLCVADFDGYFKRLNPAWSKLLGYTDAELCAVPFVDFIHPDDREATIAEAAALNSNERNSVDFVNRYRKKDGDWVWLSWTATSAPAQAVILATARDVTKERAHVDELNQARQTAEDANRSKTQFLATMSHELRTPLNAIIGFSKILEKNKSGGLTPKDLTFTSRVRENGTHLLHLINEILDLSKVEAGQMTFAKEPCEIATIADAVYRLQGNLANDKPLELICDIPEDLGPFLADQHRLRQVLINLVANAVKFTSEGSVTIRARPHDGTTIPASIEVIDTGIGIPEDKLLAVFEPFKQADGDTTRSYGGTGLGLAISRSMCEGMGLTLEAKSNEGQGSTFRICIPETFAVQPLPIREADGSVEDVTHGEASALRKAKRVLVIDDNADARQLLAEQLRDLGCEVRLAQDGGEGLRIARTWCPDLITLDLMMPSQNGWQVLEAINASDVLRSVPVVVVSMAADESRATLVGAIEVLRKPLQQEDLERILGRLDTRSRRALIVEDNADARILLSQLLEEANWEVAEAIHGAEGFAALERFRPDVVFLDLMMPVMDGAEFLKRLRANPTYKDLPVVVVSAKEMGDEERSSLLHKTSAIIDKGENLADGLRAALGRILAAS